MDTYLHRHPTPYSTPLTSVQSPWWAIPRSILLTTTEDILDAPISDCELQTAIKQLKNKKSPGEDQIHAEFLKHAGKEARNSIRMWFQKIWEMAVVPSLWKKAIVVPILKADKDPLSTYLSD